MKKLAVAMIVKNEEIDLPKCLMSFRDNGLDPEFYLYDTGSTDNTKDLAKSLGCKVFEGEPIIRFDLARNESLRCVQYGHDWIMTIDADEELDPKLAKDILDFIENPESLEKYDAVWIHNLAYTKSMYDSKLMIVKAELVESREVMYTHWIHEEFDKSSINSSRIFNIYGNLYHFSLHPNHDTDSIPMIRKNYFYSLIAKRYMEDQPTNWYANFIYAAQYGYYLALIEYNNDDEFESVKRAYEKAIMLINKELDNLGPEETIKDSKTLEFRFIIRCYLLYIDFMKDHGIMTKNLVLLKLIPELFKIMSKSYPNPSLVYLLADLYIFVGNKANAVTWLETIKNFKVRYYEDMFGLNDYTYFERHLEMISQLSWDLGNQKRSLEAFKELLDINPENEFVASNIQWYRKMISPPVD